MQHNNAHIIRAYRDVCICMYFFLISDVGLLLLWPLTGILYQPPVIMKMIVEKQMECRLAGETKVLGGNLPQSHFVHHKPRMTGPGFEPGPPRWEVRD
jgi:hypothetical protein